MFVVFFGQSQNGVCEAEPEEASSKESQLIHIPVPVHLIALELQELGAIGHAVGDVGSFIYPLSEWTAVKIKRAMMPQMLFRYQKGF